MPAFSAFNALAGAGGIITGGPFLLLSNWIPAGSGDPFWATIRFHTDGAVFTVQGNTSASSPTVIKSTQGWHEDFTSEGVPISNPGAYDIKATKTLGDSFNIADNENTWLSLSVNRNFGYQSTSGTTYYGEFTFEIRNASTLVVLASQTTVAIGPDFA